MLGLSKRGRPIQDAVENLATQTIYPEFNYEPAIKQIEYMHRVGKQGESKEFAKATMESALMNFVEGKIDQDKFNDIKNNLSYILENKGTKQSTKIETNLFERNFKQLPKK